MGTLAFEYSNLSSSALSLQPLAARLALRVPIYIGLRYDYRHTDTIEFHDGQKFLDLRYYFNYQGISTADNYLGIDGRWRHYIEHVFTPKDFVPVAARWAFSPLIHNVPPPLSRRLLTKTYAHLMMMIAIPKLPALAYCMRARARYDSCGPSSPTHFSAAAGSRRFWNGVQIRIPKLHSMAEGCHTGAALRGVIGDVATPPLYVIITIGMKYGRSAQIIYFNIIISSFEYESAFILCYMHHQPPPIAHAFHVITYDIDTFAFHPSIISRTARARLQMPSLFHADIQIWYLFRWEFTFLIAIITLLFTHYPSAFYNIVEMMKRRCYA